MSATTIETRLLDTLREMGPQSMETLVSLSGLNLSEGPRPSIDYGSRTVSLLQTGCGRYQVRMTELACWL